MIDSTFHNILKKKCKKAVILELKAVSRYGLSDRIGDDIGKVTLVGLFIINFYLYIENPAKFFPSSITKILNFHFLMKLT